MDGDTSILARRRLLEMTVAASTLGLAGCLQDDVAEARPVRAADWCIEEYDVEVPESERTAESIDGIQRDPDDLRARGDVAYRCEPQNYQLCANCRFFIPSTTTEPIGACAIVEGRVQSQDWCGLYEPTKRIEGRRLPASHSDTTF